jgi:TonB family protein
MKAALSFFAALLAAACASPPVAVEPFPEAEAVQPKSCADRPPIVLRAEPSYPPAARAEFQPGWVILEYDIGADGVPSNIRVVRSSPPDTFDGVSRRALREWRFAPNVQREKCRADFRFRAR